ncbi:hypothetical protein JCM3770_007044 [Rhodotorula araucariae]
MSASGPAAPHTLEDLITSHRATLSTLYAALSPAPQPLIDAHLAALHKTLADQLAAQQSAAEAEVAAAEDRLAAAWARVHDWQQALGEPLRPAKARGDGPLLALVDDVERIRTGMKGRMEERGTRILALQERLRSLATVVGSDWLEVELESAAEEGRWEDLNLKLERMGALEREIVRCEAEIAHRRELLNTSADEIFALRSELGIHQESADASTSALVDPLDEEILWHLGVGDARQPKRELVPTMENVQRVEAKRKWLEDEKNSRNMTIQTTYDKLFPLWTMLGVSEDEMEDFVNRHMGSTLDVVTAYQDELARMLTLKRSNMSAFIAREREALTALWDALYVSHAQRLAQFPAYAISVEPTRVWNAAHGCEDEVVSENVSEELLVAHERERERLEREVEEARPLLERLQKYFEVVEKMKELEAAAADPSRLMDKSRGAAGRLAQEAKDRKRVDRERPKLEAELRVLIPQWEAANGRPFLINGVGFIQGLDEQIRAEELEKENRKRAKMGASASSSSARPLKPQHTGASTMAPLKRQMTGASARSTTSSCSGPPAPKRLAAGGSAAPTPAASRIGRPKSALGDANGAQVYAPGHGHGHGAYGFVAATPAPLKAQATGTGTGRARAGTVGARVAQTPLSTSTGSSSFLGASVGAGMRIPHGWGLGADTAMSPSLGAPAARAPGLAHKHAQPEFEEEFVEDEFDDLEEVPSASTASTGAETLTRGARFAEAQAEVQAALKRAKQHGGRSHLPSPRLLNQLVRTSEPAQLADVLRLVAKWRAANLPAPGGETAALLVRRLAQLETDDGHAAVELLANRDLYGVDVPADLKALYSLFAKLSRPQSAAAEATEANAEAEADPAAATGAYRILSTNPVDLAFVLHGLAVQYAPGAAATDAVILLSTLAAAARTGELASARVGALVAQVQAAGEEALVRQAAAGALGARWRDIVRMRARVVAEKMREAGHPEVEWFAHLAESLHALARK